MKEKLQGILFFVLLYTIVLGILFFSGVDVITPTGPFGASLPEILLWKIPRWLDLMIIFIVVLLIYLFLSNKDDEREEEGKSKDINVRFKLLKVAALFAITISISIFMLLCLLCFLFDFWFVYFLVSSLLLGISVFILIFFVGNVWKFSKWIVSVVSVVSKGLLKGKN